MAARKETEYLEQCKLFKMIRALNRPELKYAHASANGGKRNITTAVKLKKSGVLAGIPDIFIPFPCGDYHGLFIEMKSPKGTVSPAQRDALDYLFDKGYRVEVCYSAEYAFNVICDYIGIECNV